MVLSRRHAEFVERIIAATVPIDPTLKMGFEMASHLMGTMEDDEPVTETTASGDLIVFPTSDEEFEEMIRKFGLADED